MKRLKRIGEDENGRLIYKGEDGSFYQKFEIDEEDAIFINLPLPRDFCPCLELLYPMDAKIKMGDAMVKLRFLGVFDNIEGGGREVYVSEGGEYYYKVIKGGEDYYYPIRDKAEIEYINEHLRLIKSGDNKNKKQKEQN